MKYLFFRSCFGFIGPPTSREEGGNYVSPPRCGEGSSFVLRQLLALLLFSAWLSAPVECADDQAVIDLEALRQYHSEFLKNGYVFDAGWKFKAGDNAAWALPEWDDSTWDYWSDEVDLKGWQQVHWGGKGWFRFRFQTAKELAHKPLILVVGQIGTSQIYLDGKRIGEFATVGKSATARERNAIANAMSYVPVRLGEGPEHVLAVCFSNLYSPKGFVLMLSERESSAALQAPIRRSIAGHKVILAIPLGIALAHFTLFLFAPGNREYLYCALFTMSVTGLIFLPIWGALTRDLDAIFYLDALFKFSLVSTGVFQLWFICHFFQGAFNRSFKVLAAIGCALGLFVWTLDVEIYYVFLLMTYPEALAHVFRALFQKRPGVRIVGFGVLIFVISNMYQGLVALGIIDSLVLFFPYIYSALALMLAMSIYLAQIFARTYQNLRAQLAQAEELAEREREREREARRLEERAEEDRKKQRQLERDNAMKELALEEAREQLLIYESLQQKNWELQEIQVKLVQSDKMASLGNLVTGIAHEINQPVGDINRMHETLMRAVDRLKGVLETKYRDLLKNNRAIRAALQVIQDANRVIATGTERVTEIVHSLRSFARLDEAEMKEANLHEGIETTLTLVHHDFKNRIEVVREYGDIPTMICFPSRLNQVFLNVLVNAEQAIEEKGKIGISTRLIDNEIEIAISDTGKGIPRENLARVFDPGFTTKGVGVGTGLGLSICYQIIQDHKGSIRAESEVGKGTTFTIRLPLSMDKAG